MSENDVVLEIAPIVVRVGPLGLHRFAGEFLNAALACCPSDGFSPVPYYLVSHSIELALKAFCLAKGETLGKLKNHLRHDLCQALACADTHGLRSVINLADSDVAELQKANAYYAGKGFEYFQLSPALTGYLGLPDLPTLKQIGSRLLDSVQAACSDCVNEGNQ